MGYDAETAVKSAAEQFGEPLSDEEYRQWRLDNDINAPTKIIVLRRTGTISWEDACSAVGVDGIALPDHIQTSVNTAKSALIDATNHAPNIAVTEPLTKSAYRQYHNTDNRTLPDDIPAPSTVANILGDGSWRNACERVGISPDNDLPTSKDERDTHRDVALKRGRPTDGCECGECDCELHTYPDNERCIWCRNESHRPATDYSDERHTGET